ncbi:hypothetical protein PoB_006577200 [Plakobranchus ocellatus]|uniref:Uncharacterized protein n=1 Tax=Plakobranchus ocellatus TaxID=259542 RepID=A0AAV4D529_9GAST|nr:hypothetical protein PoB_006577200 [Plakobranchus ocellatus]
MGLPSTFSDHQRLKSDKQRPKGWFAFNIQGRILVVSVMGSRHLPVVTAPGAALLPGNKAPVELSAISDQTTLARSSQAGYHHPHPLTRSTSPIWPFSSMLQKLEVGIWLCLIR